MMSKQFTLMLISRRMSLPNSLLRRQKCCVYLYGIVIFANKVRTQTIMTTIIGIDPGSRKTGYGVIQVKGNQTVHLTHGCLLLNGTTLAERLQQIFLGLREVIQQYQPQEAAIEQVFMHENANSALKLGHARGAALVAIGIPIVEYSARVVKQAIVGYGAATKEQVQQMVKRFLNLQVKIQSDASDALAIALCHAHSRTVLSKLGQLREK